MGQLSAFLQRARDYFVEILARRRVSHLIFKEENFTNIILPRFPLPETNYTYLQDFHLHCMLKLTVEFALSYFLKV